MLFPHALALRWATCFATALENELLRQGLLRGFAANFNFAHEVRTSLQNRLEQKARSPNTCSLERDVASFELRKDAALSIRGLDNSSLAKKSSSNTWRRTQQSCRSPPREGHQASTLLAWGYLLQTGLLRP